MITRRGSMAGALAVLVGVCAAGPAMAAPDALAPARTVAVQDGGRVKPLETYARESVKLVTGRATLGGQDSLLTLLLWSVQREETAKAPLLDVRHYELRAALGLPAAPETTRVSYLSLRDNPKFMEVVRAAADTERNARTTAQTKALELHTSYSRLEDILTGSAPRIVATPTARQSHEGPIETWLAPDEVPADAPGAPVQAAWSTLRRAAAGNGDLATAARGLGTAARAVGASEQPSENDLAREVHYYQLNPVGLAMWCYALGAIALFTTLPVGKKWLPLAAGVPVAIGFLLHGYALLLRVQISGRPPVTNMYESILWCAWTAMLFAFIFEAIHRIRFYAAGGAVAAWLGMAFAGGGLMPVDEGISPLVPVLRSNFWLTVHVPTIVASYGAFALAWVLGHVAMGMAAFAPTRRETFRHMSRYIYRALQVGVLLLAAGTILGGVWAADSWGRFWGWDPKEVGALLALLIYLAALHGRFAGWWHDFGLSVSAVMGFYGVLMAWVGVNMLGVGLHAYGFSKGGPLLWLLVALFLGDMGFCAWAAKARGGAKPSGGGGDGGDAGDVEAPTDAPAASTA